MKSSIVLFILVVFAPMNNAIAYEDYMNDFGLIMVNNLIEIEIEKACNSHVSEAGFIEIDVDSNCILKVNTLRNKIASAPNSDGYLEGIDIFMRKNSIPIIVGMENRTD
ncbi:hypothetical protein A1QO_02615 [Vibrio genomosp. F10 str. ZF-129]|uniref:Uncharacterized protein n=1 Tax=Vibrio genomosp. F10 str. ZF-129 TaxID=1187848 RepID=A0A1E5BLH1_9VIBR|nr:hypothetical protein [Vibrio genomosp. F10]OEE38290.1 hypothetical protein A1QO_02615 [Vibrio genomosp. F10 str. ZF-129]